MTKLNDKEIEELFKDTKPEIRYVVMGSEFNNAICFYSNKPKYTLDDGNRMIEFGCTQFNEDYYYVIERPSAPTYTKEFSVRGDSNIESVFRPCEILFQGDKYIVVRNNVGREFVRRRSRIIIRDIDTRTDVEKAAEEYATEYAGSDFVKTQIEDAFKAGVKWSGWMQ